MYILYKLINGLVSNRVADAVTYPLQHDSHGNRIVLFIRRGKVGEPSHLHDRFNSTQANRLTRLSMYHYDYVTILGSINSL